tara:strand:+ start:1559 stop:1786 length:228 start_codon:yes stop_codon:yes gene_type:complete
MANSDKRIVYLRDDGGLTILIPSDNCDLTVEEMASKDVPTGKKYKIINTSDVSSDRTFRNAWTVSESDLTDGVGS